MELPKPTPEHLWLRQLVGRWTWVSEHPAHDDHPAMTMRGTEVVEMLGELWVSMRGEGDMGSWQMTIGFDATRNAFVGSWVGSMTPHHWVYEGAFEGGDAIALIAMGPDMLEEGKMSPYKDVVRLLPDGRRILTGNLLQADGSWSQFMLTEFEREV